MQIHIPLRGLFPKLPGLSSCEVCSWSRSRSTRSRIGIALLVAAALPGYGQAPDLTQKSLEDLMNIEVTSVSKKEQRSSEVAAAIFVISAQDIRRSGALDIPDLLRMVPGLDVAQIDAGKWAISARGFNDQYSDKLLVMIDGRTVYNPEFAGVFWDSQNVPLDTIDRIEVIRGPGAAVWGSNAVNGVINIITKKSADTQGGVLIAGAGNTGVGPDTIRYGGAAPRLGAYRVYAEGFHDDSLPTLTGTDGHDDWRLIHGGFRTDASLSAKDTLTTEGEVYQGNAGEISDIPVSIEPPVYASVPLRDRYSGWNLLATWDRTISARSQTSLKAYFDRWKRGDTTYVDGLDTFDIDFQQHLALGARQDIVWGLGYRINSDGVTPTARLSASPADKVMQLFSAFAQDEIGLHSDNLHLSLGARVEHNDYTGFDFEPSVRLAWTPDSKNMLWSAVSQADRTPARSDTEIRLNYSVYPGNAQSGYLPILVSYFGNPKIKNEYLTAFEAGYRSAWTSRVSVDSTLFYNRYRDVDSDEPQASRVETTPAPTHLLIPITFGNGLYGETHGFEAFANWKVTQFWTLSPGYAYLSTHLHTFAGSQDFSTPAWTEGGVPDHQAQLRSSASLPWKIEWDISAFFVNRLPAQSIPSYTRLDTGIDWRVGKRIAISLVGQNLLRDLHPEYNGPASSVEPGQMRRSAYAKIAWSF